MQYFTMFCCCAVFSILVRQLVVELGSHKVLATKTSGSN